MTFSANLGSANIMATSPARTSESRLTCMAYDRDGENVLEVNGALDLSSAPSLCARIEATFGGPAGRLLIDLSGLEFCDSAGLRACSARCRRHGSTQWRCGSSLHGRQRPPARLR